MPMIHESLRIITAGSKYVVRRLPKAKAKEAKETILRLLSSPSPSNSGVDDLEKLSELKEKGVITEEEFQQKKKQILGL